MFYIVDELTDQLKTVNFLSHNVGKVFKKRDKDMKHAKNAD